MKIAYLILAHDNPLLLKKLVGTLKFKDNQCYVHIDKKASFGYEFVSEFQHVKKLEPREAINWGGFSSVHTTLRLMENAASGNFDRYVLISGTSYPVKSNEFIEKFYVKHAQNEFINHIKMPGLGKSMDRLDYYYLENDPRQVNMRHPLNLMKKLINESIKKLHIRREPFERTFDVLAYGGSTWWELSDNSVKYILDFSYQNPEFLDFFRNTLCSDEIYFQTILCNSNFKKNIRPANMFTDWTDNNAPNYISEAHLKSLNSKVRGVYGTYLPLFARKFKDEQIGKISIL